ncbi:hypothetical protein GCM10011613_30740 [Cellvibrio zantedeschiae]|uniref:DUF2971 domain-containing protein n=2 Tax=Cellvibrio zantedeschiae TaxID=1237077 RepID=A0ABQ3B882_9GAMM|nr:hypothetical protein GCM10011613_30740 [Cellvibrio zantedeschiae]
MGALPFGYFSLGKQRKVTRQGANSKSILKFQQLLICIKTMLNDKVGWNKAMEVELKNQKPNILYHYCSTPTFRSIIETRSIYLSLLSLSNDDTEGKIITKTIKDFGTEQNISSEKSDFLVKLFEVFEIQFRSLGFCLSGHDDLLSQWREYGNGGKGVAIGFSLDYLQKISTDILNVDPKSLFFTEVFYEDNVQNEIRPLIEKLYRLLTDEIINGFNHSATHDLRDMDNSDLSKLFNSDEQKKFLFLSLYLIQKIHSIKSSCFYQEKEWRLFDYLYLPSINTKIKYKERNDVLTPYRVFNLPYLEAGIFQEIVLGPNHPTPIDIIKDFLRDNGFIDVEVRKSTIPYRNRN